MWRQVSACTPELDSTTEEELSSTDAELCGLMQLVTSPCSLSEGPLLLSSQAARAKVSVATASPQPNFVNFSFILLLLF